MEEKMEINETTAAENFSTANPDVNNNPKACHKAM
jgi:hypothetical protein